MSKIEIKQFRGIRPIIDPPLLAGNEAQTANNCKIRSGSLDILNADLPSATVNQFSFTDGFGTWTLSGTTFKLNGGAISQTAPAAPTVTAANAFLPTAITSGTFSVSATAPSGTPGTAVSGSPAYTQTSFTLNGNRLTVVYTLQPMYLGLTTTNVTYPFTLFAQNAAVTINASSLSAVGSSVALAGGVGTIKVENIEMSPATVTWKMPPGGTAYTAYVSEWTVTFEFTINYTSDLAIERAVVYRLTTVTDSGTGQLESPASDITSLVSLQSNQYSVLTGLPNAGIKRLYRAAGTELNAKYYFVAEIPDGTATYNDLVSDADLGEVMPAIENPPATMTQVVWLPGGFCAGFYGKDIYFSDAFMLYSWPSRYTMTTQKNIVGLAVSGNDLIVLSEPPTAPDTDAKNYILTGVAPEVMTMAELMVNEGCSSRNSICKVGQLVGFAAPDGYVLITGGTGKNITEPFYNRSQWSALTPANMIAKEYDSQIVLFTTATPAAGIIIDYLNNTVRTFSDGGSGVFTWKSKVFDSDQPVEMHVAKIEGAAGTHTLTLLADGVSVYSETVTAGIDTPLWDHTVGSTSREMTSARSWELEISGSTRIDSVSLIHRERIVVTGPVRLTQANTEGSWRRLLFQFPDTGRFKVLRLRTNKYPQPPAETPVSVEFFRGATSDGSISVLSEEDIRLTGVVENNLWEIDVQTTEEIFELLLIPRQVEKVTGPVFLRNRPSWKGMLFEFPETGYFKVGRVRGADGNIDGTLSFYANESETATKSISVSNNTDFRITGLAGTRLLEVEFVPTLTEPSPDGKMPQVDEVMLIPRTVQQVNGPVVLSGANRSTWLGNVFRFSTPGSFKVARIRGTDGDPLGTLNIYKNEALNPTRSIAINSDLDVRIATSPTMAADELWEVGFVNTYTDRAVDEMVLIPREVQTVSGPVVLSSRNRVSWKGNLFYFPRSGYFKVVRVRGNPALCTLNFRADESDTVTLATGIVNDTDIRLADQTPNDLWEVELADNSEIDEVVLWPQAVQETNSPVIHQARGVNQAPATWLAQEFRYPEPVRMRSAQVKARTYPVTLTIYCDGTQVTGSPYTVANATEFRLTQAVSTGRVWEFDASVAGVIDSVTLFAEQLIQPQAAVVAIKYDGVQGVVSTLAKVVRFAREDYFSCARVDASVYPVTLTFYRDGVKNKTYEVTVRDKTGFRLPKWQPCRTWEIDAVSSTGIIYTVSLAKSMSALRG
jgi:hypothetical protein